MHLVGMWIPYHVQFDMCQFGWVTVRGRDTSEHKAKPPIGMERRWNK
jgi:hypothetical protein